MLWFLLTAVAYATALAGVVGAVGFVAVQRYALLQRLLAAGVDRVLGRLVDPEGGHSVTHTDAGVLVTDLHIRASVLQQTEYSGSRATAASVARAELEFPSLSRPLTLRLAGISLAVQQVRLPKPRSAEERAAAEAASAAADKAARLAVVEELLWGSPLVRQAAAAQQPSRWNPAGGLLGRLQAKAVQRLLGVAVQLVRVEIADVTLRYVQYGEPGPRPSASYLQGADGACLRVRSLTLLPQGSAAAAPGSQPGAEAADAAPAAVEASAPSASTVLGALGDAASGAAGAAGAAAPDATAAAAADAQRSWWQSLLQVPALLWDSVITDRPSSTCLAVSGVSLSLLTYPSTWAGFHAAQAAAAAAAPRPAFSFTPGAFSAAGATERASPHKRRRPRVTFQLPPSAAEQEQPEQQRQQRPPTQLPPRSGGSAAGAALAQDVQQHQASAGWQLDYFALLQAVPAEEHVLFQQWELTVTLCLLPPGYTAPAAAPPGGGSRAASPSRALHRRSSSSQPSASSTPRFGRRPAAGAAAAPPAAGQVTGLAAFQSAPAQQQQQPVPLQRRQQSLASAGVLSDDGSLPPPHLHQQGSLGVDGHYDTDHEDELPPLRPSASGAANGPASPQQGPPLLDRSSMAPELPTVVTPADRQALGRLAWAVGHVGDGGVLPTEAELQRRQRRQQEAEAAAAQAGQARAEAGGAAAGGAAAPQQPPEQQADGTQAPSSSPRMVLLDVSVSLKALIPEFNAASLAILSRLADRQLHHSHYGAHWASRPQVPVHGHAASWWQHTGEALAAECGRTMRREVPLSALPQRYRRRQEYQALYAASHTASPGFQEPGRRWWQRRRVQPAAADDLQHLQQLEANLTAEEIAHFRLAVAVKHNARLSRCRVLEQFVMDKVDAVVYNRVPPPAGLAQQLLHHDQPWLAAAAAATAAASAAAASSAAGQGSAAGAAAAAETFAYGLRFSASCPKLGVALCMTPPAAAPPEAQLQLGPGQQRPAYVQVTLHSISAEMDPSGTLGLEVDRLVCGPCEAPLLPVPRRRKILSSPSSVCRRVCKAADFFQYAVHGTVAEEARSAEALAASPFLALLISPRLGSGGLTVDCPPEQQAAWARSDWRPGGSDISVQLAAVALVYHTPAFAALLEYLDGWSACRVAPWSWRTPAPAAGADCPAAAAAAAAAGSAGSGGSASTRSAAAKGPPPLPDSPESVPQMVLQSFSAHGVATLGTLSLEGGTLEVHCPGIAVQLPYEHNAQFDIVRMGGSQAQAAAAGSSASGGRPAADPAAAPNPAAAIAAAARDDGKPPLRYALTVTMQNLQLLAVGEDAGGFLQGRVARRMDASAYVDVFSYLSSESRHVVASRLIPARVTFDANRRTFTDEGQEVDSLEAALREMELASMAKVWAHPDDLATIIQGIRSQEQLGGPRLSLAGRVRAPSTTISQSRLRVGPVGPVRLPASLDGAAGATAPSGTGTGTPGHWGGASASGAGGGSQPGHSGHAGRGPVAGGMPEEFLHDPSKYPVPLIPFLKCGSIRAHTLQPLSAAPDEPGGGELAMAVSSLGLQTWVSPLHIWHLLSVEKAVHSMFDYLERTTCIPYPAPAEPAKPAQPAAPTAAASPSAALVRPVSPKLLLSFGVAQVSLLWLIGTWTPKGSTRPAHGSGGPTVSYRRAWGISVQRDDDAYLWARWLAPVYSVTVANIKTAMRLQTNGSMTAGASVDGIIVRDLQLSQSARHAYVLRPLPARARRLNTWHAALRRTLLGIAPVSHGKKLWARACQTVFLRARTSAIKDSLLGDASPLDAVVYGAPFPLAGPQIRVKYASTPATRFRPAAAELQAELGQMLACVRIKQQASMNAFATQLTQITSALGRPSGGKEAACKVAVVEQPPSPTAQLPKLQNALKVTITVVGIDMLFRVQSRQLMSLKLEQGRVTLDQRAVTRSSGPRDVRMHVAASVQDVVIQDLRARKEHSLVLIPHGGEDFCTLELAFTSFVDPRRAGPRLNILVQNPRVLLMLRFVADVMDAVSIITSATSATEEKAAAAAEGAAAAGAPATAAAVAGGVRASQAGAAAAAVTEAVVGDAAAGVGQAAAAAAEPVAAAAGKGGAAGAAPAAAAAAPVSLEPQLPPLEIMVQLSNVGVVLPTSSDSTSALGASIDHLLVAMPGAIMPEAVLADCELPQVVGMMQEAVQCTHEFKYSSFHETNAAARAAADAAVTLAAAERAERDAEKAEKAAAERSKAKGGATGPSVAQRLKQGMERVGEAAAAEAMGASDIAALSGERRMRAALRAKEERQRPPGVLYLNERDAQALPSGVLHIDASQLSMAGAPAAQRSLPRAEVPEGAVGATLDQTVAGVVENIGRGIKSLFEGDGAHPEMPAAAVQPAGSVPVPGRRASVAGPRSPSVQVVPGDVAQTNLTPLLLDATDEFPAGEERPLADPSLLISIEAWTVRRGQMQLIPNFYRQAPGKKVHAGSPPTQRPSAQGAAAAGQAGAASEQQKEQGGLEHKWSLPPSLTSFSWPVEVYDLVEGALFWQPTSIALGLFTMPDGQVPLVHFSCTPLDLILNAPNYTALMDFVGGNLDEFLHPERHAAQLAEQPGASMPPAAEAVPPPPPPPAVPPQVQYNPSMKFGPEPGRLSKLRLTIASPRLSITFEAHPREWQDPTPAFLYACPKETPSLKPFMRAQAGNLLFDLGVMPGGETFMKIVSTSIELQDLRTAYRLQEFLHASRQAEAGGEEEEEEEGMATPASHFSDSESERCGPTLAELEADRRRSGLLSAAQAGSAEAADALAPPEVRQRVLSDAAADLLHDELSESQRAALLRGCSPSAATAEAVAGGGVADVEPQGLGRASGSGPAMLQQRRLEHQGSEITVGQPTPRPPGTRSSGAEGGLDEDEGTLGTPATPSTGGFSFMLPGSQQGQAQPTYQTPGLPGLGLGGMPPLTEGRRTTMAGQYGHTGNRLSVARRLSEQAERRRSLHTPSTGASGGPPSAARPSPGAGSQGAGGSWGGGGGYNGYHYSRVIELLPEDLVGQPGDDAAVIKLLTAASATPPHEATGSRAKAPPGSNPRLKLEVSLAMHADSTMAVEVAISEALLNWPYFHDLSLIWSISNIFSAPGSPQRPPTERNNLAPPDRVVPPPLPSGPSAWLYFNLLITQSQIFIPIYEVAAAQELCTELWGSAGGPRSEFERLADMALAVAAFKEADETGELLGLEQRGLALSATALRFAYAYGGDGESNYRVDLRDTAAFVRDRSARVNCAVLPFSCKVDVDMKAPQAAEVGEIERLHHAASAIQRAWRAHCTRKMLDQATAAAVDSEALARSAARSLADFGRRSAPRRLDSMLAAVETVEGAAETINKPWQLIDDIVMHLAVEQGDDTTRSVLLKYKQESQERSQLMYLQRFRATASTVLRVEAGQLTLRGAFSHIPFWQTASRAVDQVVLAPVPAVAPSAAASPTRSTPGPAGGPAAAGAPDAKPKAPPPLPFRPTALQVSLAMQQGTLVLCNDKPETFGAPDVLQCTLAGVSLAFDQATPLPKRTNMAARLNLKSYASFLNSSTSRWEALYDPWPLQAEYVNVVSPIYESDRQENVWLTSEQHLDLNFNPASLLSIGDARAFIETVQRASVTLPDELEQQWAEANLPEFRVRELRLEQALHLLGVRLLSKSSSGLQGSGGSSAAAQAVEQAALASSRLSGVGEPASDGGVLSRAPQKYLIQNQSGMKVFYWAEGGRDGARRSKVCHLENGRSETLQVVPASKRLSFAHFGSAATGSERLGATINLHFEGNWMPVLDVAVNVVGKYRYRMTSPADSTWVPLIIDIILVGRTKIITLHSGIWLENQIDMDINVRLHVPTTSLVPPPAGTSGRVGGGPSGGDVTIGPLTKHSGCYLPVTAALGGLLFLRPSGYREASRDVVRLSPDINHLLSQQGYISCEPEVMRFEEGQLLHVALQAAPAKLLSEFQAFKHMECLAPGAIQRASSPLEVTLSVQPTLVLQNALPYDMRILLWQHMPAPPAADATGPQPAASGPVEPPGPRFSGGPGHATTTPGRVPPPPSPIARESIGLPFLLDFVSPRGGAAQAAGRRRQMGRYVAYTLRKGGKQSLYVDMRQVVQLHASVEEIGMRSARWTTISHGVRYTQLPDGTMGLEAAPKLPQDVPMRMLGVGMELPASQDDPSSIDRYLAKLKDAALHLRLLHAQFHSDTKAALSSADVEAAVGRVRALAKRFVKSSRDVVARGASKRKGGSSSRRGTSSRGRERFPTMAETRGRRGAVVELSSAAPQPVAGASGRLGEPLGSTVNSELAEAAAEAAAAALQAPPAAGSDGQLRLRQQSAGHIIVEAAPRPQVTARALDVPEAAANGQSEAGAAELTEEERALQRQAVEQAQQAAAALPVRPPTLSLGLGLNPLREESVEGSQAQSISVASTPKGASGSTAGGLPAAAGGLSSAASPSQASDAQLLSEVPLSAGGPAAAAGGVAEGRVTKRRAGPSRFSRALNCFGRPARSSSGPPPAPSAGTGRVTAAPVAAAGSAAGGASTNPSPSLDSRASSRVLLSDRVRRSDLLASTGAEAGEAAAVQPAAASASGPAAHGTSSDQGEIAVLEAVPESSAAEQTAPGAEPSGIAAAGAAVEAAAGAAAAAAASVGSAAVAAGSAAAEATARALAAAAAPPASGSQRWWKLLRTKEPQAEEPAGRVEVEAVAEGQQTQQPQDEQTDGEAQQAEEPPGRRRLRAAFQGWRMRCLDAVWRRKAQEQQPQQPSGDAGQAEQPGDGAAAEAPREAGEQAEEEVPGSPESSSDDEAVDQAQLRAPAVLHLGLHNSLSEADASCGGSCTITLFAPYWFNNRTGVDLFYQDRLSAPGQPLLLGHPLPWDYGEVFTPGTSMEMAGDQGSASNSRSDMAGAAESQEESLVLDYKLVLMNKQEEVMVGLAHVPNRRYSSAIQIKTVGNKSSVELRGPVDAVPPEPMRPSDMPAALAKGLHRGVRAAAAGAIAGGKMGADMLLPSSGPDSPTSEEEAPPPAPIIHSPSEGHLSAVPSSSAVAGDSPPQLPSGSPGEPLPAVVGAAEGRPARLTVPHSPFDAPAAPGGSVEPSPRELRRILSAPASQEARLSQLHGPSPLGSTGGSGHGTPSAASAASRARHLRRASMQEGALVETLASEPGTLLVRLTSTARGGADQMTPSGRQLRRLGSSIGSHPAAADEEPPRADPEQDEEAEEAVQQMQQVPIPGESSTSPPPRAAGEADAAARPVGMEEQQAEAPQVAAPPQAGPPAAGREAPVIRQVSHVTEAAANMQAHAEEQAALPPPDRRRSSMGSLGLSLHHRRSSRGGGEPSMATVPSGQSTLPSASFMTQAEPEQAETEQPSQKRALVARPDGRRIQRAYEFAVDVAAGPPDSMFRHTKLLTLKPKFMIHNETGMPILVKQYGTENPDPDSPDLARFARKLLDKQRAAVYWDDAELARELVIKPLPHGDNNWCWSGSFPIRETEWYFGLRIRHCPPYHPDPHKRKPKPPMNIPVNVTVGPYGAIQVTLKSPKSVSPYRIHNACKDVVLHFVQLSLVNRPHSRRYVDCLEPNQSEPYAWDEPTQRSQLRVQAKIKGEKTEFRIADYALDQLGDQPTLMLPTHGGRAANAQRRLYKSLSSGLPDDLKQKLVSLLAAEFSKKVYVTVYADGPTRVLRFSDDRNLSSQEARDAIRDLAARSKQVETQLRQVNAQFARLNDTSGAHVLDLYGRTAAIPRADEPQEQAALQRKASKRIPLSETTRALIRQAHSKLPREMLGGSLPGSQAASQPSSPPVGGGRGGLGAFGTPSVSFDRAIQGARAAAGRPAAAQPAGSRPGTTQGPGGVLRIPDESDERAQRLLPYRRLVIRTGSEPAPTPEPLAADSAGASGRSSATVGLPSGEIQPADSGDGAESQPASGPGHTTLRVPSSSSDVGHLTPTHAAAGSGSSRRMGSITKTARRGASKLAGQSVLRPGQDMLQDLLRAISNMPDAVLLLGGDLTVQVLQAQSLAGNPKSTHAFARVYINEPFPSEGEDSRAKQTSVVWQTCSPVWDESLVFRDVCTASELVVEIWDLGGNRSTAQMDKLTHNPSEVIKSCRFLGRAEMALSDTWLSSLKIWLPLMRCDAGDTVSGQVQLDITWEATPRSVLTTKLRALERVLAQRQEILAALRPVPASVVRTWAPPEQGTLQAEAAERTVRGGMMAAGVSLYGVDNELGMSGAGWGVQSSKVAAEVLARHAHDHNRRHLVVTVLEARGLAPRRGVVVALSASELPKPEVSLELKGYPLYTTPVLEHTLQPRWDASVRHAFMNVDPAEAALTVRLHDARGGFLRNNTRLLGEATIHCSHIKGESPTYVWVPLSKPRRRRGKSVADVVGDEPNELQVHLRLQWRTDVVRGKSTKVEVNLAGLSMVVMGGLQDELFNLTTDEIRATALRSQLDMHVEGSIQKVQLDNQMLDAVQPVVLAPAVEYKPSGAVTGSTKEPPLVAFRFTRSFAGEEVGEGASAQDGSQAGSPSAGGGAAGTPPGSQAAPGTLSAAGGAAAAAAAAAVQAQEKVQSIKSFKDIRLDIGAMDLMTDEAFLEAVLSFMTSIPTADIYQEKAWQQQQQRLLDARFGPREVESLAINAIVPAAEDGKEEEEADDEEEDGVPVPIRWVLQKETRSLEVLHGQSDLASWYFIESAEIGPITLNVTVSLSSRLLSTATRNTAPKTTHTGTFNRALGASGFSLVNVANVPILLGRWVVGNDPAFNTAQGSRGLVSNGFLSQKALVNNLYRHYTREGLKEAHKVLGGAGPAVASVPLTVLWAGGSAFALITSITKGNTGPVVAVQQLFYVPLMTMSMLVSGFSRMLAATLAAFPPYRLNGDEATVQRIIRRPNSALEAGARAPVELVYGFTSAAAGMLLDPITGWQQDRWLGLTMGLLKGSAGLLCRPFVGALEGTSKLFYSLALASLGREGILGRMQRRVKAPGTFTEEAAEQMEEGPRREAQLQLRALMAAWQRVLPEFFPQMAEDMVEDVVNIRSTRVVLITDRHIAYLRARHMQSHSIYKAKWLVPISELQNLSGDSETLKISITHVHRYDLWLMGVWPVAKRKGMRCGSRPIYERMVVKLSRLLQKGRGEGGDEEPAQDPGLRRFAGADLTSLTILSQPYAPPPALPQGRQPLALPAPSQPPTPHDAAH